MTGGAIKRWVIAELKAATITGTPNIRTADINDLPSQPGVYVALGSGTPAQRQFADSYEVRIITVAQGEAQVHAVLADVQRVLQFVPGQLRTWVVNPAAYLLRLQDIAVVTVNPPAAAGIGNDVYSATIVYRVRGRA